MTFGVFEDSLGLSLIESYSCTPHSFNPCPPLNLFRLVHFTYPNEREYSISVESNTSNNSQEKKLFDTQSKQRIQEEFSAMIRRLLVLTETFPPLPKERHLILRLQYRKDTPTSYEPAGFSPASSGPISPSCLLTELSKLKPEQREFDRKGFNGRSQDSLPQCFTQVRQNIDVMS